MLGWPHRSVGNDDGTPYSDERESDLKRVPAELRLSALCAIVLLLLYLLLWVALPPSLRWLGEAQGARWLGREVRIGRVDFTPWKLDLVVEDIQVAAAPDTPRPASRAATPGAGSGATPLVLSIGKLHADFAWASVWRRVPVIEALEIDTLRLRASRSAEGRYDVEDLVRRLRPEPEATTTPLRFALYNLQLRDAVLVFDDRLASRVHAFTSLRLSIPFISNLPAQVDVKVEPHLDFVLNGVAFDSGAFATPFAPGRSGELKLKFARLDLAPFLEYLPDSLPARLAAATLSTDLTVAFSWPSGSPPSVLVQGRATAENTQLNDRRGNALLGWRRLDLDLRAAAPLQRRLSVSSLRLDGARWLARRKATGEVALFGDERAADADARVPEPVSPPASAALARPAAASPEWQVVVDRVTISDAAVAWHDAGIRPAADLRVDALAAELTGVEWPLVRPVVVSAKGTLRSGAAVPSSAGRFTVEASTTLRQGQGKIAVTALPLETFDAYFAQALTPQVGGRLSAQARLDWPDASGSSGAQVTLEAATVDALALRERRGGAVDATPVELAAWKRLSIADAKIDIPARSVSVARLELESPSFSMTRGADGGWDVERWKAVAPAPAAAVPPADTASAPWRVLLQDAVLTDGRFAFSDAKGAGTPAGPPLRLAFEGLRVAVQNLAWQGDRPTVPAQIALSGRVGPFRAPDDRASNAGGAFDWRGVVGVSPVLAIGSLKLERLPLHPLIPYIGTDLPFRVAHAELGYDGNLSVKQLPAGVDVDAGTDVLLGAVRLESADTAAPAETLLSWNTLGFKNLRLSMKPGARPQVDVAQATLDDFYARLVVGADGKLNLSGVAASRGRTDPPDPLPPKASASTGAALPLDVRLDGTVLTNGRIDFSDRYVRPNYSAGLTELNGRLGALRSDRPAMATLSLRGKAAGTALLDITGAVNPLARPPTLDLRAKATDLELAPLSPYAGKYAGYAIERGKLSMDVSYRLDADGHLEATNRVVLNQLTFGARIESPTATRLPVLLAVALLKDRNGVIDLDLPISGSLEDPQFSVGGTIGRLLGSLLLKAITSPFALLAGGAGGGDGGADPGQVEFLPGTSRFSTNALAIVDKIAAALVAKPNLVLTVTGSVDTEAEQDAYRSAVVDERVNAVRRKQTVATAAAAASSAEPPLDDESRARLVKQLYSDSDLPDKPLNVLGFAKGIPLAEMEARLKAGVPVDADAMRALALQRGVTVREALIAKGLSSDRLFLAAPRVRDGTLGTETARMPAATLEVSLR